MSPTFAAAASSKGRLWSRMEMVKAAQPPLRAMADNAVNELSAQLRVRSPEIEGHEERRVKRKPSADERTQD
jgi:hypothetical protein